MQCKYFSILKVQIISSQLFCICWVHLNGYYITFLWLFSYSTQLDNIFSIFSVSIKLGYFRLFPLFVTFLGRKLSSTQNVSWRKKNSNKINLKIFFFKLNSIILLFSIGKRRMLLEFQSQRVILSWLSQI